MTRFLPRAALAAVIASACLPAVAAPPTPGESVTFGRAIICDTQAEAVAVAAAARDRGADGMAAELRTFRAEIDAAGEPSCDIGIAVSVIAVMAIDIGDATAPDGSARHLWAIEISDSRRSAWVVYIERPGAAERMHLEPDGSRWKPGGDYVRGPI